MHHRAKDLSGLRFGYLTAVAWTPDPAKRRALWVWQCDCGGSCVRPGGDVEKHTRRGGSPSCGCHRGTQEKLRTHGRARHPAYAVWRSMVDRCRLPTHQSWKNYGGRGITVCPSWVAGFAQFWADMGPTYQPGLELDRRDNQAGYSPENCRWVTRTQNARNRRSRAQIQADDAKQSTT